MASRNTSILWGQDQNLAGMPMASCLTKLAWPASPKLAWQSHQAGMASLTKAGMASLTKACMVSLTKLAWPVSPKLAWPISPSWHGQSQEESQIDCSCPAST